MERAVVVQPGISMNLAPAQTGGLEQGLEPLLGTSSIVVKQHYEMLEILAGFETKNRYKIKNQMGQEIFYAYESTSCCNRYCCGANRGYTIRVVDMYKREILTMTRPFKMCKGNCFSCVPCCADETTIMHGGQVIGSVEQTMSCYRTCYVIKDGNGEEVFEMKSPNPCVIECFWRKSKNFKYTSIQNGSVVGRISKKFGGFLREIATDADVFGVEFPPDLDVKMKATLIGATFLIDFMHFEESADAHGPGNQAVTCECCCLNSSS